MKSKIVGAFVLCGLEPEGIIEMGCRSLDHAKSIIATVVPKPTHWCLSGMYGDDLMTLYESKDGIVIIDKFSDVN